MVGAAGLVNGVVSDSFIDGIVVDSLGFIDPAMNMRRRGFG